MTKTLQDLFRAYELKQTALPPRQPPRPVGRPSTGISREVQMRNAYLKAYKRRLEQIVIADFETDPFNSDRDMLIIPFLFVYYTPDMGPQVLWRDTVTEPIPEHYADRDPFILRVIDALTAIPGKRIIYAHNGGRFDWKFLARYLSGRFMRKGNSIMKAFVGNHEIRDSLHIFPAKLATVEKQKIDYDKMSRDKREAFKQEIVSYCISDCISLYEIVKKFVGEHGFKLSIGQAAMGLVKAKYPHIKRVGEHTDGKIRGVDTNYYHEETYGKRTYTGYYAGGRVGCLVGQGEFIGPYFSYDVNSMYPAVMANVPHPIGNNFTYSKNAQLNDNTCFVHIRCRNHGALVKHMLNDEGIHGLTSEVEYGEFHTTIHEFNVAFDLGLIEDVQIISTVECDEFTTFADVIHPLYNERQQTKLLLQRLEEGSGEWREVKMQDTFLKLLLNNMYGKFAQDPRKYQQEYLVQRGDTCIDPEARFCMEWCEIGLQLWKRKKDVWNDADRSYDLRGPKDQLRFYNVATGASITGAARAILLQAIFSATDPIYCDTDSIICRALGPDQAISPEQLGGWKIEREFSTVLIAGKKTYGYIVGGRFGAKSKGVSGLTERDFRRLLQGEKVIKRQEGVTIGLDGRQAYQTREISANAPHGFSLIRRRLG